MWSNPRVPYQMTSHRKRLEPPGGKPIMVSVVRVFGTEGGLN